MVKRKKSTGRKQFLFVDKHVLTRKIVKIPVTKAEAKEIKESGGLITTKFLKFKRKR